MDSTSVVVDKIDENTRSLVKSDEEEQDPDGGNEFQPLLCPSVEKEKHQRQSFFTQRTESSNSNEPGIESGGKEKKTYFSVGNDSHVASSSTTLCERLTILYETIKHPLKTLNAEIRPSHGVGIVLYFEYISFVLLFQIPVGFLWLTQQFIVNININAIATFVCLFLTIFTGAFARRHRLKWRATILANPGWVSNRSVLVSSLALKGMLPLVPSGQDIGAFFSSKMQSFSRDDKNTPTRQKPVVTNVMSILDIGLILRLRRKQAHLREISVDCLNDNEYSGQITPEKNRKTGKGLGRLFLCQLCRDLAQGAAKKKQSRFRRYADAIDSRVHLEELQRDIECTGCVIITFQTEDQAMALLQGFNINSNNDKASIDNRDLKQIRDVHHDHAKNWWFSRSTRLSSDKFSGLGDTYGRRSPLFVRVPPEPNDINFEAFTPAHTPSYVPWSKFFLVLLIGLAASTSTFVVVMFLGRSTPFIGFGPGSVREWEAEIICSVLIVVQTRVLMYIASKGHVLRPNSFSTFTLEQKNVFETSVFFYCCSISPVVILALLSSSNSGSWLGHLSTVMGEMRFSLVNVAFVTLALTQAYPLVVHVVFGPASAYVSTKTWDIVVPFPIGQLYAESFSSTLLAFALSPAVPWIVLVSSALQLLSYLLTKNDLLYHHKEFIASSPRFGADVSVRLIQFLPWIGWLQLLSCVVHLHVRNRAYSTTGSPSLRLTNWDITALSVLCLGSIFFLLWWGMLFYPYDSATPRDDVKQSGGGHIDLRGSSSSSLDVVEMDEDEDELAWSGATISFDSSSISSNSRDWQAALSLHQLKHGNLKESFDEYRLPWVAEQA